MGPRPDPGPRPAARPGTPARAVLTAVVEGTAPWALNEVEWDATPLRALVNGGKPARNQLGCGDLNLLIERDRYLARTSGVRATVWTPDELLPSYA
ncbi:hypothetical protein ACIGZI_22940 [Streptomyces griseus]|uniref:hypothetical protein n=1 Tax=Streptomyces griseus TaxID=1911 RepID=UPI0037CD2D08